ncbi:MAG TPA: acyl-CoA synthetase [Candidatus Binatia bacterium]|jgi:acyl-CoA synthetase (AMP-forming)/AMP-acid ligase II|nr:acyl-CoA synthetase [Candidatus Binatia bacterium]
MNLGLAQQAIAARNPDRECIVTPTRRLTYAQVAERARRLGNVLHAAGLGCRTERAQLQGHESGQDHLGIYMLNRPEYLESMLGAFVARVAPFNVNYRYVEEELLYLLTDSDAVALVYEARYAPTLARIRDRMPKMRLLLQVADDSGEALLPGAIDYETALAGASADAPPVTPSADDLYILYTGGTTGAPKGVLWRQEDIFHGAMTGGAPGMPGPATIEEVAENATANGGFMRVMTTPPLMHGAAQWLAFGALHQGGTVVLQGRPDKLDPVDVLGSVEREGCNTLTLVGDAFARPIVEELKRTSYDLSKLFVIGSGGAILSPHMKEALIECIPHAMVIDGFGSSETGAHGSHATRAGDTAQTGKFAMANTLVLKDDLSGPLPSDSRDTGWLARAGHVPLGYYKDAAKTAKTFPTVGGTRYAVPGDHATFHEDGSINVLGRGSVCINSGGEKIYPEEVEQVLRKHPAIYDAVVVGTPDERFGEQVNAVVQPREGMEVQHAEVGEFAARHLARYKLPKAMVVVEQIVRSPSGKPDYRWAKAQAMAARAKG